MRDVRDAINFPDREHVMRVSDAEAEIRAAEELGRQKEREEIAAAVLSLPAFPSPSAVLALIRSRGEKEAGPRRLEKWDEDEPITPMSSKDDLVIARVKINELVDRVNELSKDRG